MNGDRVFEIGPNGVTDLSMQPKARGLVLKNAVTGQEAFVEVHDRSPQMGDVHVEGRMVVVASVEHYVELAAAAGWYPVDPTAEVDEV